MGLRDFLVPQDKFFFELFKEQSKTALESAEALQDMIVNYEDVANKNAHMKDLEHKGDAIAHEIYQRLNRAFITPIDQEDMAMLASMCDDIVDGINGVSKRLYIFEVGETTLWMKQFAEIIVKTVREVDFLYSNMRKISQEEVDMRCKKIDELENLGDELLHTSLANLFKNDKDAVRIIKLKEVYEWLETVLDRCEDAGYMVADIVLKNR